MKPGIDTLRRVLCALLLSLLLPGLALGQDELPPPGARIRLRLIRQPRAIEGVAPPQLLRGDLVSIGADSVRLRIHPTAGVTAVAREGIERFDVSRGVRSRLESAAVTGTTLALFGSIERVLIASFDDDRFEDEDLWQSALIGAAGGALIGITVGALMPRERWQRLRNWSER